MEHAIRFPSIDKRIEFVTEISLKIPKKNPSKKELQSALLAVTYWFQAETININQLPTKKIS